MRADTVRPYLEQQAALYARRRAAGKFSNPEGVIREDEIVALLRSDAEHACEDASELEIEYQNALAKYQALIS